MLSRAESANVGFSQVVQLFAPPTNAANAQKIPFINLVKNFSVSTMCTDILGFSRVRVRDG